MIRDLTVRGWVTGSKKTWQAVLAQSTGIIYFTPPFDKKPEAKKAAQTWVDSWSGGKIRWRDK